MSAAELPVWTAEERESFFAAIARHRRAAWQVSAVRRSVTSMISFIRSLPPVLLAVALAGCTGETPSPNSDAPTHPQPVAKEVVYIEMERPEKLLKLLPAEPDPAYDAHDPISCKMAGGEWDDEYFLGTMVVRERPEEGAEPTGQSCWSTRQPTRLADAGKPCSGQADCIGNCVAELRGSHYYGPPRCQTYVEGPTCGPIYDGGRYHWIACPIP